MNIDFAKGDGLVPVIVQDARTRVVLMLGYMNTAAFEKTQQEGLVTFYSRTRQSLWTKGETSGNFLKVETIALDCDRDTLLIQATPTGPVCHTGTDTCFEASNTPDPLSFLHDLTDLIHQRRVQPQEGSYTQALFQKGINKIAQKVGEEAVEVVIEAKDEDDDLFQNEVADLLFHLMILLEAKGFSLADIVAVLEARHQPKA